MTRRATKENTTEEQRNGVRVCARVYSPTTVRRDTKCCGGDKVVMLPLLPPLLVPLRRATRETTTVCRGETRPAIVGAGRRRCRPRGGPVDELIQHNVNVSTRGCVRSGTRRIRRVRHGV